MTVDGIVSSVASQLCDTAHFTALYETGFSTNAIKTSDYRTAAIPKRTRNGRHSGKIAGGKPAHDCQRLGLSRKRIGTADIVRLSAEILRLERPDSLDPVNQSEAGRLRRAASSEQRAANSEQRTASSEQRVASSE